MADDPTLTTEQQNEILFMQLVLMFKESAYQHMGKVMNPATNTVERNLTQAKQFIDVLGMLEAKTKGNLSDNEQRFVDGVLTELRMNYVDESKKPEPAADESQGKSDTEAPAQASSASETSQTGEASDEPAGDDAGEAGEGDPDRDSVEDEKGNPA